MTINDHDILEPEYREMLEQKALQTALAELNGEPVDTRDTDIMALLGHIRALEARNQNYARIFRFVDNFADGLAEHGDGVALKITGKLLQQVLIKGIDPTSEEDPDEPTSE